LCLQTTRSKENGYTTEMISCQTPTRW